MRLPHWSSRTVILSVLVLCLAGCAVDAGKVYVKDGKEYGVTSRQTWRARWWDYYDRGSSYAAGEYWNEALADFQAAIRQRHDDQRQARTYGMHRSDYFPHRELGIVYYRQGHYTEVIDELTTSLSSVDTAKAKFYLNKARRSFLQQTRRDTAAPRIVFTTPPDELLTNRLNVTVAGYAEDDTYVSALMVNRQAQFVELAEPRLTFTQEVELRDGASAIDVVADDPVGQQTRARRTVHLDRHGPLLSLEQVEGEDLTPPTVKTLVEGLVWKLQRQFPLAEGVVLEKAGKQLFTDLNERHGVKRSMKLLIFRPGQEFKHPQTGRLLKKPDVILGEARITAVSPDLSEALVLPSEVPGDVRESDTVITK